MYVCMYTCVGLQLMRAGSESGSIIWSFFHKPHALKCQALPNDVFNASVFLGLPSIKDPKPRPQATRHGEQDVRKQGSKLWRMVKLYLVIWTLYAVISLI